jgi:lipoprotein NlpI
MEAAVFEPQTPSDHFPARVLQFSEYRDWGDVAAWAARLFQTSARLPAELQPVMDRLRALPTPEQRASEALQWVQTEVRYFSVSLGESSHRPYPPAVVMQRRYGDCKDKTLLLVSMLRELGIDAAPALLSADALKRPSRVLASPDGFDHVVARVNIGGATYYLDATRIGQRGALSRINSLAEGTRVLVVDRATTGLTSVPAADPELFTVELQEAYALPELGKPGRLVVRNVLHGSMAESHRLYFARLSAEQKRQYVIADYERRFPGIAVEGDPVVSDDVERNIFKIESTYTVPTLAKEVGGQWVFSIIPANLLGVVELPPQLSRNSPAVVMRKPYQARYDMTLTWPAGITMAEKPSTERIDGDFFHAEIHEQFHANVAAASLRFNTLTDAVDAKDLTRLAEDIKRLERLAATVFIVPPEALQKKPTVFAGFRYRSLPENIKERHEAEIQRLTRSIQNDRLEGKYLAEALCDRAHALDDIERATEGLADAMEASRVAPAWPRVWECRARLHYSAGKFEQAMRDHAQALSLGYDRFRVLYVRGPARFYAGQYADAAEDFEEAVKLGKDSEFVPHLRMWQIWSLQRAGKPVPEELREIARKEPFGPWPLPALAMTVGAILPEQMLAMANQKQGDDRALALAEAWFFAGQHYRAIGETAKAREAWQKARAQGITMYVEHRAAGFELAQQQ